MSNIEKDLENKGYKITIQPVLNKGIVQININLFFIPYQTICIECSLLIYYNK